jgi:hypothetical protein
MTGLLTLLLAGNGIAAGGASQCGSFLYEPSYCLNHALRGRPREYLPQPGDIMLATKPNFFWTLTHNLSGAYEPHSSALVVAREDGTLGIMEAGPDNTPRVRVLDMLTHLREYECQGRVWIRKRCTPLTAAESACLTEFAMRQDGKRFALGRLGLQLTPVRTRGPLRTAVVGKPHGERSSYFCSELVLETLVYAGLLDAQTTRPAATYPCELFFDQSRVRYLRNHFSLAPDWEPPARWVSSITDSDP